MSATNLILFLSDNHRRSMLGAYGNAVVRTPNLDRMAVEGARFENAYCASPVCCPARAALATGRYPHQTGYWDNSLVYDGRVPSWHHRLREQGHVVTSVGKLHFRSAADDNGYTEEIIPMHIIEGKGALFGLLRASPEGEPPRKSPMKTYLATGVGEADYVRYDLEITSRAVEWLGKYGRCEGKPWVLVVSYSTPHPPFQAPQRYFDLYPWRAMPLPVRYDEHERPQHPALAHLRKTNGYEEPFSEELVRRVYAGYCALTTFLDEQVGRVLHAVEELGLLGGTRVFYTSDHGEAAGAHGVFGKCNLYENSAGVPLIAFGPGIPAGRSVGQLASHVDLFPTLLEGAGARVTEGDRDLAGVTLWPAMQGRERQRAAFGEYHAHGSKSGMFMLRKGDLKLVYHVGMPAQLFDLAADPDETVDLLEEAPHRATSVLVEELRRIVDPEAVDLRAKADQWAQTQKYGGAAAILARGSYGHNPIPGEKPKIEPFGA